MSKLAPAAAEAAVVAAMLDADAIDKVRTVLTPEDFSNVRLRTLFEAVCEMASAAETIDPVTLIEYLDRTGRLEKAGGTVFVADTITQWSGVERNVERYVQLVRERARKRKLAAIGRRIVEMATEGSMDAEKIAAEAETLLRTEMENTPKDGLIPVKEAITELVDYLDQISQAEGGVTGLSTGLTDLDRMTCGLHPGDLVVIAGRPSMGKTAFALRIVEHALLVERKRVAFFSLEMPAVQLVMRLVASMSRTPLQTLRSGDLGEIGSSVVNAGAALARAPLYIDETPAISISEIAIRSRRLARQGGLDLIVVDYLQLVQSDRRHDSRNLEVSEISRTLKALAKELAVPVVALSQLNRNLEQRQNKRPTMADLRDSGQIEQDSDLILFLYRDEVYNEDSLDRGIAEVIVGKQRNGPIGSVRTVFLGEYARFENAIMDDGEGLAPDFA